MRARAEKIGAAFAVDSRPGEGTTIEVIVPPEAIARAATESAAPRAGGRRLDPRIGGMT